MFRLTPKKAISPDLCYLESLPETLASFLPSQARQAGYKEYDTTHLVPLPHSCSPGEAQARGDRGFSEPHTLGSGLPSPCTGREDVRAERRHQWPSHHPPASAQVTRVWLRGRCSLRAGYWRELNGAILIPAPAAGPACPGPVSPREGVGGLWGTCRDPRVQGHTSHLRPAIATGTLLTSFCLSESSDLLQFLPGYLLCF